MTDVARAYVAEFVGTLILVLVGTMSIVGARATGAPVLVVVPLGFGLGLLAGLYAFGEISGGHFNPAVSLAALLDGRIDLGRFIGYVIAQIAGGIVGSLFLLLAAERDVVAGTVTGGGSRSTMIYSEVYLTAIFVLVILAVTMSARLSNQTFTAMSLSLAAVHFAGIPFSGASVNPARSLAPAVVGGEFTDLWIYLIFPLVGAVIAWVIYSALFRGKVELNIQVPEGTGT